MNNETNVTTGVFAGAVAAIMWWVLREWAQVDAPAEVIAASVVVFTAVIQYFAPKKEVSNGSI